MFISQYIYCNVYAIYWLKKQTLHIQNSFKKSFTKGSLFCGIKKFNINWPMTIQYIKEKKINLRQKLQANLLLRKCNFFPFFFFTMQWSVFEYPRKSRCLRLPHGRFGESISGMQRRFLKIELCQIKWYMKQTLIFF